MIYHSLFIDKTKNAAEGLLGLLSGDSRRVFS